MKSLTLALLILFMASACSFKEPHNAWQIKSAISLKNYERFFLSNQLVQADNEIKKSILHAQKSANLETLSRVYLTECALNLAVLKPLNCQAYLDVNQAYEDPALLAYYALLNNHIQQSQIYLLPLKYQAFASALLQQNSDKIQSSILNLNSVSSQLIASSVAKTQLQLSTVRQLIKNTSEYGYQQAAIQWMQYLANTTPSKTEAQNLKAKIKQMLKPA